MTEDERAMARLRALRTKQARNKRGEPTHTSAVQRFPALQCQHALGQGPVSVHIGLHQWAAQASTSHQPFAVGCVQAPNLCFLTRQRRL
jgi:hypothetical protein